MYFTVFMTKYFYSITNDGAEMSKLEMQSFKTNLLKPPPIAYSVGWHLSTLRIEKPRKKHVLYSVLTGALATITLLKC